MPRCNRSWGLLGFVETGPGARVHPTCRQGWDTGLSLGSCSAQGWAGTGARSSGVQGRAGGAGGHQRCDTLGAIPGCRWEGQGQPGLGMTQGPWFTEYPPKEKRN